MSSPRPRHPSLEESLVTAARPLPLKWSSGRGRADGALYLGVHRGSRVAGTGRELREVTAVALPSILPVPLSAILPSLEGTLEGTPNG